MGMTLPSLTPAQESLFLTLGGRALDSRLPRPFLDDTMADDVLATTGYDLGRFRTFNTARMGPEAAVFDIAVRAKRLHEVAARFIARHPHAVVLDLGSGLDSRVFRVDLRRASTGTTSTFPKSPRSAGRCCRCGQAPRSSPPT